MVKQWLSTIINNYNIYTLQRRLKDMIKKIISSTTVVTVYAHILWQHKGERHTDCFISHVSPKDFESATLHE